MKDLIIDSFAGGGGASQGIYLALGRSPDVAINHNASAIEMHAANHPETRHYTEDVWKVSPRKVTRGRRVALLWASPDCKHFSRAKGGKPVEKSIRSLAWIVVRWAEQVKPAVIILENVREFAEWGPLIPRWECGCGWKGTEGQAVLARKRRRCPRCNSLSIRADYRVMVPDPDRKGLTFRRFTGRLRNLGYIVQTRVIDAADFGAPTHRRRLFLIARRDGLPIQWPEPTHGDPATIEQPSLFAEVRKPWRTAAECIDWSIPCPSIFDRKRPLAEKTLKRIALGIKRYVLDNPRPFLVVCNHGGPEFRGQDLGQPLPTIAASRDAHGLVTPFLARIGQTGGNGHYSNSVTDPMTSIVSKAEHLLIAPTLIQSGYGEREGQSPRVLDLNEPIGTMVSGCKQALVAAFLSQYNGQTCSKPRCYPADEPLNVAPSQNRHSIVAANLVHLNHGEKQWSPVDEPMRSATAGGNHAALVYSFLVKYFGTAIGSHLVEPLPTVTAKDRFGLVTVTIEGQPYVIVDIGMRMLRPRELARGQGFPDSYILTGSKSSQVEKIGNSVSPCVAEAIVRANCAELAESIPGCRVK